MKEKSLKEKTLSGLGWSGADKLFQQVFVFASGILLARMLDRDNYGLIGVLYIFIGLANLLHESGFSAALIRKKDVSEADYTTVFYSNIFIGIFLYIILFFSAPFISDYYEKPILIPLARFIFLSFLFNSFAVVQNVRLIKDINYKTITKINFFSIIVSYLVALTMAYCGMGVWALASQLVLWTFLKTVGLWIFGKWKPSGKFSKKSFNELFAFSSKLLAGNLINSIMANLPQNVLGKFYTIGIAGLYNQATRNYNAANEFLSGSLYNVSYPVLSTISEEDRLKRIFRKFMRAKALVIFPMFMGIILVANPFMHLLGEQWLDAAPLLQFLCLIGIFTGFETSYIDILRIKGKSEKILAITIVHAAMILFAIFITFRFEWHYLYFMAILSTTYFVKYIISIIVTHPLINYRISELLKDILPYFGITTFCILSGYLLHYIISNPIVLLICQIAFVSILYFVILYFSGSALVKEAIDILKKKPIK